MTLPLITRGPNSFTLTVPPGTTLTQIITQLGEILPGYGWEVWDAEYAVFRSPCNDNVTYKYLRFVTVAKTGGTAIDTVVYESWDNVSHTGGAFARGDPSGLRHATSYDRVRHWLTHSTGTIVLYFYINIRWFLIASELNGQFGFLASETSGWTGTIYADSGYNWSSFTAITLNQCGPYYGASGCVEIARHGKETGKTTISPFVWVHTMWAMGDTSTLSGLLEDGSTETTRSFISSYWDYNGSTTYPTPRRVNNSIARLPRLPSGTTDPDKTNVDVLFVHPIVPAINILRVPSIELPRDIWTNKEVALDIGLRVSNIPLGYLYGLKLMRSDNVARVATDSEMIRINGKFFTDQSADQIEVKHWYVPTYGRYRINYRSYSYRRYQYTIDVTTPYNHDDAPRFLIPA